MSPFFNALAFTGVIGGAIDDVWPSNNDGAKQAIPTPVAFFKNCLLSFMKMGIWAKITKFHIKT
ncbi:hypothetical protein GCM10007383_18240 [Arenibacter certesii]|uniref:Uncharacterized protein n=1 Tax=Arenibacter certesii TaxID=228955 RepID=A0A918IV53_9FLAO|nr:hypothetical protein GCM10007383_18240 [Arenibacter certesii]